MKKIIYVCCVATLIICTFCLSAFAAVPTNENPYFYGSNVMSLGNSTIDGSYSSYPVGVYIDGSFDMPFKGVSGGMGGETREYKYSSVTDLIIDYTNYRQGTFRFYIEFYDENGIVFTTRVETQIDDNGTGTAADDVYQIAAFNGNDNIDQEYKKIVPIAQPYIAFNLGALIHRSNYAGEDLTHFKVSFVQSECYADFRIYGVMANYDVTYQGIYNKGYNSGYVNGEQNGYSSGYTKGHSVGKQEGISSVDKDAVYNEGWEQGFTDGVMTNDAYDVGFEDGKEWQHNYDLSTGEVTNFLYTAGGALISFFLYLGNNINVMGFSLLSIIGIVVVGALVYIGIRLAKGN